MKAVKRRHVLATGYVRRDQLTAMLVWNILDPCGSVTLRPVGKAKQLPGLKPGERALRVRIVLEEL